MFSHVFSKIPEIVMRNPSVLGQPVGGGNSEYCVRFDTLGCDGRRLSEALHYEWRTMWSFPQV